MAILPEKLKQALCEQGVDSGIVKKIYEGFEEYSSKIPKRKRVEFIVHAIKEMDNLLDVYTRKRIMESCSCSTIRANDKNTIQFINATRNLPLGDRVQRLKKFPHLWNPVLREDGTILIRCDSAPDGQNKCNCFQLRGIEIKEPISLTYCMCCGGHFRVSCENLLGIKLEIIKMASPLESMGKEPCTFMLKCLE